MFALFPAPLMVPVDGANVIVTPLLETALPNWSCTCTVTAGVMEEPAATLVGGCTNPSLFVGPAETLNADDCRLAVTATRTR